MNKSRLEAFSDGVMAIIITIMVLELKTPKSSQWQDIQPLFPVLESYAISFIMIGIYWGNHHHMLHAVTRVNGKMIWANLHFLFWISLVPFFTRWMGETNFEAITIALYAALLLLCGLAYTILLKLILRAHTQNPDLVLSLQKQSRKGMISVVGYLLAIPLAYVHPLIAELIIILIAVVWWLPDRNVEKAVKND